jgi:sugar lactone lactonase YvrE
MLFSPKVILPIISELGEGPTWHPTEKVLYWVDILQKQLHRYDPKLVAHQQFEFDMMPGAVVPYGDSHAEVLLSFEDGLAVFNTHTHKLDYVLKFPDYNPNIRANDGKCDAFGNFWIGTMSKTAEVKAGNLYMLNTKNELSLKIANTTISNGLTWNTEATKMYYIDTMADNVRSFDMDHDGNINNEKIVISGDYKSLGYFDGMTIDTEGMLWIAHFNGFCIRRWNPETGEILLKIDLPVPQVTSLTFGGENLSTLYITSARENMSKADIEKYPLSGSVFSIETNFRGLETNVYKKKN